jgi:hypothetical protein
LKQLGITIDFGSKLKQGYGESVIQVLQSLADLAIEKFKLSIQPPKFKNEE